MKLAQNARLCRVWYQRQVVAAHYLTSLPDEETLRQEIIATRRALAMRGMEEANSG